jgi:hypothetical protein
LIIAGESVDRRGVINDTYLTVMDLAPTFLEIANAEYPDDTALYPMLGESMASVLAGNTHAVHDENYATVLYLEGRAVIRQGDWKLTNLDPPFDESKLAELQNGASAVDAHMAKYEAINAGTDKAEQMLTVSAFTQFAVAMLVMLVAAGGAFINFKLIALPMSEMVGAGDYLTSSLRTSEVAALVIILVEASMGLFLMEALRITHLFPRIASLSEHLRRRMMWIALVLLVTLAGVEAALALMRDMLIADKQALLQSLATAAPAAAAEGWVGRIPTAGQMLLGFILPFALAFIAVPLESLIHSSRTVAGVLFAALVDALALVLRIASNIVRRMARVLVTIYDVAIVLPLMAEHFTKGRLAIRRGGAARRRGAVDVDDSAHQAR